MEAAYKAGQQKRKSNNCMPRAGGRRSRTIFVRSAEAMIPAKKRTMIERDRPELSISQQCKLVRLSGSAFYSTSARIDADTLAMIKEIDRVFTKYLLFGSCRAASRQAIDDEQGAEGDLETPQNQPATSAASHLSIIA